jgi:hypothetical protein
MEKFEIIKLVKDKNLEFSNLVISNFAPQRIRFFGFNFIFWNENMN